MRTRIIPVLIILMLGACTGSDTPMQVKTKYVQLANRHDIVGLMDLFTDDARLDFGPMGVIRGEERIREIHEYDRALHTELHTEKCRNEGQQVICRMIERNDWLRIAGIHRIVYTRVVFTFTGENRITSISAVPSAASADSLGSAMARFDAWAQEHATDEYSTLYREDGSFQYSYDNGQRVLALLKKWREDAEKHPPEECSALDQIESA